MSVARKYCASGRLGDLAQRVLVDRDGHHHLPARSVRVGHGRVRRVRPRPDRVHADAERRRHAGRGDRVHVAEVVLAVGEQDDDAALDRALHREVRPVLQRLEPLDPQGHRVADRGPAVLALRREVGGAHRVDQVHVVERERAPAVGELREREHADEVVGAAGQLVRADDELLHDALHRGQAVGGPAVEHEVAGPHAAGAVDDELDRDGVRDRAGRAVRLPRAGETDDEQEQRDRAHDGDEPAQPHRPGASRRVDGRERRERHRRATATARPPPPHQRHEDQGEEPPD